MGIEERFYGLLARSYPLSKAFELTRANDKVPFILHTHRDVVFERK